MSTIALPGLHIGPQVVTVTTSTINHTPLLVLIRDAVQRFNARLLRKILLAGVDDTAF